MKTEYLYGYNKKSNLRSAILCTLPAAGFALLGFAIGNEKGYLLPLLCIAGFFVFLSALLFLITLFTPSLEKQLRLIVEEHAVFVPKPGKRAKEHKMVLFSEIRRVVTYIDDNRETGFRLEMYEGKHFLVERHKFVSPVEYEKAKEQLNVAVRRARGEYQGDDHPSE